MLLHGFMEGHSIYIGTASTLYCRRAKITVVINREVYQVEKGGNKTLVKTLGESSCENSCENPWQTPVLR